MHCKLGIGSPPARYDIALDLFPDESRCSLTILRILPWAALSQACDIEDGLLRTLAEKKRIFCRWLFRSWTARRLAGSSPSNSSSPLRHVYGAVRDFCLGMEFVDRRSGAQAKSGGRVVKNVTGYDLHKLLIGSLGTLAVITRLNFRTFPMPQAQGSFVASFSSAEAAFDFCRAISHSVLTPQMVEIANPGTAALLFSGEDFRANRTANLDRNCFGGRPARRRGPARARARPPGGRRGRGRVLPFGGCRSGFGLCANSRISKTDD